MKTRRMGKALVGLVAAVAAVGLLGLPASAITAEIESGTLRLFSSESFELAEVELGEEGDSVDCSGSSGEITQPNSTNGSFTGTFSTHTSTLIGTAHFTVYLTITINGVVSTTGAVSATASASATLYPNDSTDCEHLSTTPCVITVANLVLNGTSTITDHDVEVSDTVHVDGATAAPHGFFEFDVNANGNCAGLIAMDDGGVEVESLTLHITSLSTG